MMSAELMSHPIVIIYSFSKEENASLFQPTDCWLRSSASRFLLNHLMCFSSNEQDGRGWDVFILPTYKIDNKHDALIKHF